LQSVEGVAVCRFSEVDVVRHPIVAEVIKAYAKDEADIRSRLGAVDEPASSPEADSQPRRTSR
jgi:phosphate starvation-inducible PhoH-like protein